MELKVVVHEADEGGFWAVVPALPGCATRGDSLEELLQNLRDEVDVRARRSASTNIRLRPRISGLDRPL